MYSKCNTHLLEICVAISKLFNKLSNTITPCITLKTHASWRVPKIDENSTFGQQIKYYRRLANIKQTDICSQIGCDRIVLRHLENEHLEFVNIKLLKQILKILNIENIITINDEYIAFLLDNPAQKLRQYRKDNGLSGKDFAQKIGVNIKNYRIWEQQKGNPSRSNFNKLKEILNNNELKNSTKKRTRVI